MMTRPFEVTSCKRCGAIVSACYSAISGQLCVACKMRQRDEEQAELQAVMRIGGSTSTKAE